MKNKTIDTIRNHVDCDSVIKFLSDAPDASIGLMKAAKSKLESLKDLPKEKAAEISDEVKELALLTVDAVGATVCAMIACD